MKEFEIAYVPVGVPTFDLKCANEAFVASKELLQEFDKEIKVPKEILLSVDAEKQFLEETQPDLLIFQNVTFANAAYIEEVLHCYKGPLLLWTLREPSGEGERLKLNALTGAYSAANMIQNFREEPILYVFGSPDEKAVKEEIAAAIAAAKVKWKLSQLTMASVGETPEGFGFGRASDIQLKKQFGVTLKTVETRELMSRAKKCEEETARKYLEKAQQSICGLSGIQEQNQIDFAKLWYAYEQYVKEQNIGALASRCWPDFFTEYGTPVCAVLSMLNDSDVAAACEADLYGALSMYIGMQFSGQPAFFGDPVSINEEENSITYWHCGTAACKLAKSRKDAQVGIHCNRKIGPTLDFGCKPCDNVTVFRIGCKRDGSFRFFIMKGKALEKEKQYTGTSVVVESRCPVKKLIKASVREGFEPHFCVIYSDCEKELTMLGNMLGIEICCYDEE